MGNPVAVQAARQERTQGYLLALKGNNSCRF